MKTKRENIERGAQLLRECEGSLQGLVAQAASEGDYEGVLRLTAMAGGLAALADSALNGKIALPEVGLADSKPVKSGARVTPSGQDPTRKRKRRKTARRKKSGYPKFVRRRNDLIKVGWSKREKKEYEHRAPWESVQLVTQAIARAGASGEIFTSEDFLPVSAPEGTHEIPTYQGYLVLAWLVSCGFVKKHGRQGYTIPDCHGLKAQVAHLWKSLPTKQMLVR